MIERKISFFWCGDKMSWLRYASIASAKILNPHWRVQVYTCKQDAKEIPWNDDIVQDFAIERDHNYMDRLKKHGIQLIDVTNDYKKYDNPIAKSDLCRWRVLSEVGGVYADSDILFIRSLEDLSSKFFEMDSSVCFDKNGFCLIGFMAGVKSNRFFNDVFQTALINYKSTVYQSAGADAMFRLARTKRNAFQMLYRRYRGTLNNIPMPVVYPFEWHESAKIFEEKQEMSPKTIGIHWFGGTPVSQKYNSMYNEDNYGQFDNTLSQYMLKLKGL